MKLKNMQKKLALGLLAATLSISALTGCSPSKPDSTEKETTATNLPESSVSLLENVWASYENEEQFSIMGGDPSALVMDLPGTFSLSDSAAVDATLGLPEDSITLVDDAASIVHMMNANTFTCGAFHVADSKDTEALTTAIKEHLSSRQWVCGFPEKLTIISVPGDYLISLFGNGEMVDLFTTKLTALYPTAEISVDQSLE